MANSKLKRTNDVDDDENKENQLVNAGDLLSDESSFYGDAETKSDLEDCVAAYNPKDYWDVVKWNVQCLAARGSLNPSRGVKRKREDSTASASMGIATGDERSNKLRKSAMSDRPSSMSNKPYNPFEGDPMAKQLNETLDDFLTRLKPSTTGVGAGGPWIWVANPYSPHRPSGQDVAGFKELASRAMNDYLLQKVQFETQFPNKTQGSITRMLKPDRDCLEARIIQLAKEKGVTCGKWMLFPSPDQVDGVWAIVSKAVADNQLGCSAKVATDDGDPNSKLRLVCIYTSDFSDVEGVKRVLGRMQELGLIRDGERTIYYKADAYTHLDIMSGNEYKLKASMFSSVDLFAEMRVDLH